MLFPNRWWSSRPAYRYQLPAKVMRVPLSALQQTLKVFNEYRSMRVEAVCFWYGSRDAFGNAAVKAVVVPPQQNHFAKYEVDADAIELIATATRKRGWLNLCQIHTHPGGCVQHSGYDDEHAVSRKALSLVFPRYGLWRGKWPELVGVHEFQAGQWHLLRRNDARQRVQFVADIQADLLDLRNQYE